MRPMQRLPALAAGLALGLVAGAPAHGRDQVGMHPALGGRRVAHAGAGHRPDDCGL